MAYSMSPSPTTIHQRILSKLALPILVHFEGKPCELFLTPFDVRLSEQPNASGNYIDTVVQPYILRFTCRYSGI